MAASDLFHNNTEKKQYQSNCTKWWQDHRKTDGTYHKYRFLQRKKICYTVKNKQKRLMRNKKNVENGNWREIT